MRPIAEISASFHARLAAKQAESEQRRAARRASSSARGISCERCEDTGLIDDLPCPVCERGRTLSADRARQHVAGWLARIDEQCGIPPRFRGCGLDTFPDPASPTLAAVRDWLATALLEGQPGLFLTGPFGRGKSGLLAGVLRELVGESGAHSDYRVPPARFGVFLTGTSLLASLRPNEDGDNPLAHYQTVRWLAVDDLGAERLTEWGAEQLFAVINQRHNMLRPTLVTSNLTPGELAARINRQAGERAGDRIVERLIESCTVIQFADGEPNWRLTT